MAQACGTPPTTPLLLARPPPMIPHLRRVRALALRPCGDLACQPALSQRAGPRPELLGMSNAALFLGSMCRAAWALPRPAYKLLAAVYSGHS